MRLLMVCAIALLACACSSVPTDSKGWIEPVEAIRAANDDPAYGVRGEFIMTVKGFGADQKWSYLNSERDYRDQRALTIRMPTSIIPELEKRLGVKFKDLAGRRLVVLGTAMRVRIDFLQDGKRTGAYYYQTHIKVDSATQVRLVE